jgi:UDP-N-acetylmuramate dehydrogenase
MAAVRAPSLSPERFDVRLSELTTLRLGGPARRVLDATSDEHVIEALAGADAAGEPVLVVAGGSNLVIADSGFPGTVVRVLTRGVSVSANGAGALVVAAAGEPWDDLVARSVAEGLTGIECLSGIPGSTGATPIQNVGAYGQDVAETIAAVRVYDREAREVIELAGRGCGFSYRSSRFRRSARYVVLGVSYALERSPLARPVRYPGLAAALGVKTGTRRPLAEVREAVLELRRQKGMVIDPRDADSVSAGSFFVNPVLSSEQFAALARRVSGQLGAGAEPPAWADGRGRVKTSAAWLIEQAGFYRGYGDGRAGISSKHTLALVNRGGATTAELLALAREIRGRVWTAFGVRLEPEPTLVGVEL